MTDYTRSPLDKSPEASGGPMRMESSQYSARSILESARYVELDRKQSYYDCTQHDTKQYDFEGRIITAGYLATQPLLSAPAAPFYVPLKIRRPSTPYRLARSIVHAFTDMAFGQGRFPTVGVEEDPDSQDFVRALVSATGLPSKMIHARNLGGSMGTVGLSWCFVDGTPKVEVHNAKRLWVHSWRDRAEHIPAHVTEVYLFEKDEFDVARKQYTRQWVWARRDWTEQADIVYMEVPFDRKSEPLWVVDPNRSVVHEEGVCHFVWIQNAHTEEVDGDPDYHQQYEMLDSIDLLFSVITRGTTLNLDPTLVLRMDPELLSRQGVRKGSDNALTVGETGDAHYMEMSGSGINSGLALLREKRTTVLEAVQCVIPDPNTIAAQGMSSLAMKLVYAPMLSKCDQLRESYGRGLTQLLNAMLLAARRYAALGVPDAEGVVASPRFDLPPRQATRPLLDVVGDPTGELETYYTPQSPGQGTHVQLSWGPYFQPTEQDKQSAVSTLQAANGAKALISQQTAVEIISMLLGRDSTQEWNRLEAERAKQVSQQAGMFAGDGDVIGGAVGAEDQLPLGATPRGS